MRARAIVGLRLPPILFSGAPSLQSFTPFPCDILSHVGMMAPTSICLSLPSGSIFGPGYGRLASSDFAIPRVLISSVYLAGAVGDSVGEVVTGEVHLLEHHTTTGQGANLFLNT